MLPLVIHSLGAPLGEPVAEDFDFLRHWRLLGERSLLDGGGSLAFWRPVSHQLYYAALGSLILSKPAAVAAIHALLLALSAVLLYRALRPAWSGPRAAAAAGFPFLAEAVRTVVSWPSHGVELTSLLFTALAIHEASRRRLATSLAALLLALLSKEVALVAALLIPLWPGLAAGARDARAALAIRLRWGAATGALAAAWALAYLAVRKSAGLALPHQLESDPATLAVPLAEKLGWATWNSLRAVASLPASPGPADAAWGIAMLVPVAAGVALAIVARAPRGRLAAVAPWVLWGLAWFALASATLVTVFPIWAPNRALFGSLGLGIAAAGLLGAARGWLPWALVAVRLAAFAASPGPSREVGFEAAATGAFMDFPQLTRLQRLMRDTRETLAARFPALPAGAGVGQHNLPRRAEYAFGGDRALQVWYGDTTLRWVRFEAYSRDTTIPLTAIVEYQLGYRPQIALVEPAAMRALLRGIGEMAAGDLRAAGASFRAAEGAQRDPAARVFLGTAGAKRAVCRMGLGDRDGALEAARAALVTWRENPDSRYVMAAILHERGASAEAAAQLDTLLAIHPSDADAAALRERIRAGR